MLIRDCTIIRTAPYPRGAVLLVEGGQVACGICREVVYESIQSLESHVIRASRRGACWFSAVLQAYPHHCGRRHQLLHQHSVSR